MPDTIFGRIASGEVPADIVYQDEHLVAFRDLGPQAPTHVLIIPRKPIPTLNDLDEADAELAGRLLLAAGRIARELGISEAGYRVVINCNKEGGQIVFHLHMHLLGGLRLRDGLA